VNNVHVFAYLLLLGSQNTVPLEAFISSSVDAEEWEAAEDAYLTSEDDQGGGEVDGLVGLQGCTEAVWAGGPV